jgi:hypothetical protein
VGAGMSFIEWVWLIVSLLILFSNLRKALK